MTRIAVLGFAYFREELESPCQLYINFSTKDQCSSNISALQTRKV